MIDREREGRPSHKPALLALAVQIASWLPPRFVVGLALPEEYEAEGLGPAPPRTFYKGLNKYFVVERGGVVPKGLAEWAGLAYQNVLAVEPLTAFMDHLAVREKVPLRRAG